MSQRGSHHPDPAESQAILDAALDLVFRDGLAGLTLRPLAAHVGLSVAIISARLGAKEQLVESLVDHAAQRDRQLFDHWLALLPRIGPADPAARAALSDQALRAWAAPSRPEARFLIELIYDRALQATPSPALDRWLAAAGLFWSTMIFGCADHADLALGYVIDEATFAIGIPDNPIYALLRSLCLQRFAAGLFAAPNAAGTVIPQLIATLEPPDLSITTVEDPKGRRIADSAAQIIVSQGVDAVTHRSVALVADVPASTVVYHFGGRPELVVAGLNAAITRFHGMVERAPGAYAAPEEDAEVRNVTKATGMIALASLREPSLRPNALEMRRRRGDRIRASDLPGLGLSAHEGFDRAAAQVIALAVYGMRMVAMARKLPERSCYRNAFAAFESWSAAQR